MKKTIFVALVIMLATAMFVGCSDNGDGVQKGTVKITNNSDVLDITSVYIHDVTKTVITTHDFAVFEMGVNENPVIAARSSKSYELPAGTYIVGVTNINDIDPITNEQPFNLSAGETKTVFYDGNVIN